MCSSWHVYVGHHIRRSPLPSELAAGSVIFRWLTMLANVSALFPHGFLTDVSGAGIAPEQFKIMEEAAVRKLFQLRFYSEWPRKRA